jgi:hypothetical protein
MILGVSRLRAPRAEYNAWKEMGLLGFENKTFELVLTCIKLSGL